MPLIDYALFAQDSYNRGTQDGLPFEEGVTQFNGATIEMVSPPNDDGFYAIAYDTGSEIVIAYRGTDEVLTDAINGWGGGVGLWFSDQNQLAIEFYHEVNAAYPDKTISVTGHSLGGGLAGFVSGITGAEAHVFDNMTYELSANLAYLTAKIAEAFTDLTGITAVQVDDAVGDLLSAFGFEINIIGETGALEIDVGVVGFSPFIIAVDTVASLFALAEEYYAGTSELHEAYGEYSGLPITSPSTNLNVTQHAINGEALGLLRTFAGSDAGTQYIDAYFGGGYRLDMNEVYELFEAGTKGFTRGAMKGYVAGPHGALIAGLTGAAVSIGKELTEDLIKITIELMVNKHSMSLMTANTYMNANFSETGVEEIGFLGGALFSHLFSDEMANKIGITAQDEGDAAAQLFSEIAYSAATGDGTPFGTTALAAMFNDARDVGQILEDAEYDFNLGTTTSDFEIRGALGGSVVQFSGELAHSANRSSEMINGFIRTDGNRLISVDYSEALWAEAADDTTYDVLNITGRTSVIDRFDYDDYFNLESIGDNVDDAMNELWGDGTSGAFERIHFINTDGLTSGVTVNLANIHSDIVIDGATVASGSSNGDVIAGSGFDDMIIGSNRNELIDGGAGSDRLYGGGGNDILVASGGNTEIDFLDGGGGTDFVVFIRDWNNYRITELGAGGNYQYLIEEVTLGFETGNQVFLNDIEFAQFDGGITYSFDSELYQIIGTNQNDTLTGGSGNDFINGLAGNDVLSGGGGNDVIIGSGTLSGGDGDDTISASGVSTVDGGGDNDSIAFAVQGNGVGSGSSSRLLSIAGGDGQDSLVLEHFARVGSGSAAGNAGLKLSGDWDTRLDEVEAGNTAVSYSFLHDSGYDYNPWVGDGTWHYYYSSVSISDDIERVDMIGGTANDSILYTNGLTYNGGEGSDTFIASFAEQSAALNLTLDSTQTVDIYGVSVTGFESLYIRLGSGDNVVTANGHLFGGEGNDTLTGTGHLSGGIGNDILTGSGTLEGGDGNDELTGSGTLSGGIGSDILTGSGILSGGNGMDQITGSGTITGGEGDDIISASGVSTVDGGGDSDSIAFAVQGNGVGSGHNSANQLLSISGGDGQDSLVLEHFARVGSGSSANNAGLKLSGNWDTRLDEVEAGNTAVSYSFLHDSGYEYNPWVGDGTWYYYYSSLSISDDIERVDMISGTANDSILYTNGLIYNGGEGSDTFIASFVEQTAALNLTLDPTQTIDLYGVSVTGFEALYIRLGSGDDVVTANGSLFGGEGNDTLTGSGYLSGGIGSDILIGSGTLEGGDGSDTLVHTVLGSGSFNGGLGVDILISDVAWADNVLIDLTLGRVISNTNNHDTVFNIENVTVGGGANVTGDNNANHITATDTGIYSDNTFLGMGGNDTLDGGAGNDILRGNGGQDTILGGENKDKLFGGNGRDTLEGGSGRDLLKGGKGADVLDGGGKSDKLVGGFGMDILTGGFGADNFVFNSVLESSNSKKADVITDFKSGIDVLDLENIFIGELTFIGSAGFSGTAGELRAVEIGGDIVIRVDIDGDSSSDMKIVLEGDLGILATDFIL